MHSRPQVRLGQRATLALDGVTADADRGLRPAIRWCSCSRTRSRRQSLGSPARRRRRQSARSAQRSGAGVRSHAAADGAGMSATATTTARRRLPCRRGPSEISAGSPSASRSGVRIVSQQQSRMRGTDADSRRIREFQPATMRVRDLFGLSAFETELLVLTAGIEIDAAFRAAVAHAQGVSPREPCAELLARAVDGAAVALGRHLAARPAAPLVARRSRHGAGVAAVAACASTNASCTTSPGSAGVRRAAGRRGRMGRRPSRWAAAELSARIAAS